MRFWDKSSKKKSPGEEIFGVPKVQNVKKVQKLEIYKIGTKKHFLKNANFKCKCDFLIIFHRPWKGVNINPFFTAPKLLKSVEFQLSNGF